MVSNSCCYFPNIGIASEISKKFEEREDLLKEVFELVDKTETEFKELNKEFTGTPNNKELKIGTYKDIPERFNNYEGLLKDLTITEEEVKAQKLIRDANKLLGEIAGLSELEYENEIKKVDVEIEKVNGKLKQAEAEENDKKLKELNVEKAKLEEKKAAKEKELKDYQGLKKLIDKIAKDEEMLAKYRDLKVTFEKESEAKAKALHKKVTTLNANMVSIYEKVEKIEKLNKDIKKIIDNEETNKEGLYGDAISLSNSSEGTGDLNQITDEISQETGKLKDYVYDKNIFKDIFDLIPEGYKDILDESETQLKEMEKVFKSKDIEKMSLHKTSEFHMPALKESIEKFVDPLKKINKEPLKKNKKHQKKHFQTSKKTKEEQDKEEKEDRKTAKKNNDETKDYLEEIEKDAKNLANEAANYAILNKILNGLEIHTQLTKEKHKIQMEYKNDAEETSKEAAGTIDSLFSGLGSAIKGGRDRLYVNEYILSRYKSKKPSANKDDYLLENREVEYIMFGQDVPGANYAAVLVELSALRLLFNFISAFKEDAVKFAPHPIAKLILAVGFAFTYTVEDMDKIIRGKNSEFLRNIIPNIRFDYEDYVRLFLFINPSGDKRYMRMMAMIGYHGKDLTEMNTYVEGTVETSVDLLFFPQAAKILNKTGLVEGEVSKNKYKMKHEAHFSY